MDYTTFAPSSSSEGQDLLGEDQPLVLSLYHQLQTLPDCRRAQGKRYELALLVCLLVLAKLAGQRNLSAATDWVRLRKERIAACFGLRHNRMPCQMTYCRMLATMDGKRLDELLAAFFIRLEAHQRCATESSRLATPQGSRQHNQVAIDGKTVRATSHQSHSVHLLSCYDVTTGNVLWHCNVQEKQNEISALKPLMTPTLISGRIFTLDAMHTQRELCAQINRWSGGYILIAKENQPTLHEDIADLFLDHTPDRRRWVEAETWEKGHGRLEHRHLICSPDLNDWFAKEWQGLAQVFRLQRTTCVLKESTLRQQTVYGLSNLPMSQVPAQQLLELIRAHWHIENRLHWRRDVTLGEDACQTRTGAMPAILARLNSAVLSFMDCFGVSNVAKQTRAFDASPEQAIHLLLTGQWPLS